MRRDAIAVAGLAIMTLLATPLPAAAYEDIGYDPAEPGGGAPCGYADIRSTVRRVQDFEQGRFLVLIARAYEDFVDCWFIKVHLDSRDGPRIDRKMFLSDSPTDAGVAARSSLARTTSRTEWPGSETPT